MQHRTFSLKTKLFLTLATLLILCQLMTVFWIWHETKEQIDAVLKLPLGSLQQKKAIEHEQFEILMILSGSTITMLFLTLFLSYCCIKWIIKPLEIIANQIEKKSAADLNPINMSQIKHNVKEVVAIQDGINQLFFRLQHVLNEERLFTADVAHELRTPLSAIRLHLELLQKNENIDCQLLISRIDRLAKTVSQLLMLARATQNKSIGMMQAIQPYYDLRLPLKHEFDELVAHKQQIIQWEITEKEATFIADEALICLLLRNLVENSYKYSKEKTTIIIRIYFKKEDVYIEVQDQSIGIDESKSKQLMNAFFQMDSKNEGIGLGLSIVSRIAKLHHAQFSLENNNNGGTIARFILKNITPQDLHFQSSLFPYMIN